MILCVEESRRWWERDVDREVWSCFGCCWWSDDCLKVVKFSKVKKESFECRIPGVFRALFNSLKNLKSVYKTGVMFVGLILVFVEQQCY